MPSKKAIERAEKDRREGKSPSTQAGEFVREEIEHIRKGKHGARSVEQAIAIGLSEARRAGVPLKPPAKGKVSEKARKNAERAYEKGQRHEPVSKKRSEATEKALEKESTSTVSTEALSEHARIAAQRRTPAERSASARKAVATKGPEGLAEAAHKAALTRKRKKE